MFAARNPAVGAEYQAWSFGAEPDELANLVLSGVKTATASAFPLYEFDNEPLPNEGEYSVILDSNENAVCVVRTTRVYITPFCQVSQWHAYLEGEGDRSLQYWRAVHEEVFHAWLSEAGLVFSQETPVVCEEFEVVFAP